MSTKTREEEVREARELAKKEGLLHVLLLQLKSEWSTPEKRKTAIIGFITHALGAFIVFGGLLYLNNELRYCQATTPEGTIVFDGEYIAGMKYLEEQYRTAIGSSFAHPDMIEMRCTYQPKRWWNDNIRRGS